MVDWPGKICYSVFLPTQARISAYEGSWVPCDGSAYSRTDYAELFVQIGTGFGAGNGTTTFNVPDLRGFFPMSLSPGGLSGRPTARTLNQNGGVESVTLTTSTMPTHSHSASGMMASS